MHGICTEVKKLLIDTPGAHISAEWSSSTIFAGDGRKLKEKVYRHAASCAHKQAAQVLEDRKKNHYGTA